MSGKIEYTELAEASVMKVTGQAILFESDENGSFWVPMSLIRTDVLAECEEGEEVSLRVQSWFVKKEELL